ncbi:hypothetical protein GQ55_1G356300 [Panicum hallii var. hallii]|uniref:Uncharacterized protein n=1 Tax=Panicum hallii var. hallii TaxID=1504633 RepID=A0A2T7FB16_9POAL|nr:hypothetical protein GQ55_1G356300 [Panicum hallii var. hallii]
MARRRRTGRRALRDDPGAAVRRTSMRQIWRRATQPSWSPAPSHPRRRAGLEALRAAGVQGRRTRSFVASIVGWPGSRTRTPAQAGLPAAALARSSSASSNGPTACAANHLGRSRSRRFSWEKIWGKQRAEREALLLA